MYIQYTVLQVRCEWLGSFQESSSLTLSSCLSFLLLHTVVVIVVVVSVVVTVVTSAQLFRIVVSSLIYHYFIFRCFSPSILFWNCSLSLCCWWRLSTDNIRRVLLLKCWVFVVKYHQLRKQRSVIHSSFQRAWDFAKYITCRLLNSPKFCYKAKSLCVGAVCGTIWRNLLPSACLHLRLLNNAWKGYSYSYFSCPWMKLHSPILRRCFCW